MIFNKISVGTSTTPLVKVDPARTSLVIYNNHATATIYIGNKNEGANGFPLKNGASASFKIPEDDPTGALWAISDTADTDVRTYEGYSRR